MTKPKKLVQHWFAEQNFAVGQRIPPERELAVALGLSRAALRRGLAPLESAGLLLRHVGRGSFVGAAADPAAVEGGGDETRPARDPVAESSPRHVLAARIALEPLLAAMSAREASPAALAELRQARRRFADAGDWAAYDLADDGFHRAIAEACANPLLLRMYDDLASAGRRIGWGRLRVRTETGPGSDHASIAQHAEIEAAIRARDAATAELAMRHHVVTEVAAIQLHLT